MRGLLWNPWVLLFQAAVLLLAAASRKNQPLMVVEAQLAASSTTDSAAGVVHKPTQRTGYIDVLDEETLLYYLGVQQDGEDKHKPPRLEYDVVVFYYATWCKNCKALSPIYGKIAELLQAGTTETPKVVLGYFDCEANYEHAKACSQAGITHYPTLHFYSFSGQEFHRGGGGTKKSKSTTTSATAGDEETAAVTKRPRHIAAFPGNWQQGEAILDWIRVMSFLSRWHRAGWGSKLRRWVFGGGNRRKKAAATSISSSSTSSSSKVSSDSDDDESGQLPVGIPHQAAREKKLETLQKESENMRNIAVRSSTFIDSVLFPVTFTEDLQPILTDANGGRYTDVFGVLTQKNLWFHQNLSAEDNVMATVLRTCVMEAALDICDRLSIRVTERWLEQQGGELSKISDDALRNYETDTAAAIQAQEPYCSAVQDCILKDYQDTKCRPATCPFQDATLCRYITACLTDELQKEYAAAMGLTLPTLSSVLSKTSKSSSSSSSAADAPPPPKQGATSMTRGAAAATATGAGSGAQETTTTTQTSPPPGTIATNAASSSTTNQEEQDDHDNKNAKKDSKPPAKKKGWGVA